MPLTQAYLTQAALWSWGRATGPIATEFYVCLSSGTSFTSASTLLDFLNSEVAENGYTRKQLTFPSDGTFNVAQSRHQMPQVVLPFVASGGSIVFRTIFVMYSARAQSKTSFPASAINVTSNTITINAHGLVNGELISIQDSGILGLPGGVTANTLYQAFGVTANTFQLSTNGTSAIDITSAGTGPYNLIYAKGGVHSFLTLASNQTITSGSTGQVTFDAAALETTYV